MQDWLGSARLDWSPSGNDRVTVRYAFEQADDTGASTLDRSIGSATQRQAARQRLSLRARQLGEDAVEHAASTPSPRSYSRFRNEIVPVAPGTPQLTFPSIQDGASFRVPQATNQDRFQLSDSLALVRGDHSLKFGGERSSSTRSFDLGVFQAGRLEMVQDFADFDHNGDGRVERRRPAVRGHACGAPPRSATSCSTTATTTTSPSTPRTTGG